MGLLDDITNGAKHAFDKIEHGASEALHTAAYAGSELVTAPLNVTSNIVDGVTGKSLLPEVHLVNEPEAVKDLASGLSKDFKPELDALKFGTHLTEEFAHSALYSGLQQPINGIGQLFDKVTGTDAIPHLDFISKPEAATALSADWFAQLGGKVVGTVAPFLIGGTSMLKLGSTLGAKAFEAAGVTVEESSPLALRMAATATGTGAVGFGYGFVTKPSGSSSDFWGDRIDNGYASTFAIGGSSVLKIATEGLGAVGSHVVSTVVGSNAQSIAEHKGFATPADYVQGSTARLVSASLPTKA